MIDWDHVMERTGFGLRVRFYYAWNRISNQCLNTIDGDTIEFRSTQRTDAYLLAPHPQIIKRGNHVCPQFVMTDVRQTVPIFLTKFNDGEGERQGANRCCTRTLELATKYVRGHEIKKSSALQ